MPAVMLAILGAALLAPAPAAAFDTGDPGGTGWIAHYRSAVAAVGEGDGAAAEAALGRALEQAPEPRLAVEDGGSPPDGVTFDYLPHLYMAAALHLQGRTGEAREALARSEAAGVARDSTRGRALLDAYRVLLAEGTPAPGEEIEGRLPAEEVERLQERVARRCGLDEEALRGGPLPWYFHYEMGLELAAHQDPRRALRELAAALRERPEPQRNSRLYGMWFADYRPYFHIARLQLALGHRECALDALRASRWWEEVKPGDPEYEEYELIERELGGG